MTTFNKAHECKHHSGFSLVSQEGNGAWFCNLNCGYFLNFDPFEFPHGVSYKKFEDIKPKLPPLLKWSKKG
jgi:hypothetical protein